MNKPTKGLHLKTKRNDIDLLVKLFEKTHHELQKNAARSVDIALVARNWLFGWYIVEYENGGASRTDLYGKGLINLLSMRLQQRGIQGVSATNLRKFREFYQAYAHKYQLPISKKSNSPAGKIQQTLSVKSLRHDGMPQFLPDFSILLETFQLSWSHYIELLTITSVREREFYEIEAAENSWSVRDLKRQIASSLYERLALSRNKCKVKELSKKGLV